MKRSRHRTAEHAVYLASLSQVPDHLAKVYSGYDPAAASRMEEFALKGLRYSNSMLSSAHDVPHTFGLPTKNEVEEWQAAALKLLHVAKQADPKWFSLWPDLVRNRTTGNGGR
jgi:hypothetical protein